MKDFPEMPPPGVWPPTMNTHLQPVWCEIRNNIVRDQEQLHRLLAQIKTCKESLKFHKTRITANKKALASLGGVE